VADDEVETTRSRRSHSIIDSTDDASPAIGAPADGIAHAVLTMRNCTVFGIVDVHAMALAENSLFTGCVNVARRQIGCLRYCYVPCHCRTPPPSMWARASASRR
jgi:hypothetical protein